MVLWFVVVVVLAAVAAGGFWAGRAALDRPAGALDEGVGEPVTYEVAEGTVGRSLDFPAVAEWDARPVGQNRASGTVTSVDFATGDLLDVGDLLYHVDLRPVVVAAGQTPMFRDLASGAQGDDVAQLQVMLADLGLFAGEPDGRFGGGTVAAVRAWQAEVGVSVDGVVRGGDVVFVPEVPVRLVAGEELFVGVDLHGGERVVHRLDAAPRFRIPLVGEQGGLVPLSAEVTVRYAEGSWAARIDRVDESAETGQMDVILAGADGGPVCGDVCADWVEVEGRTNFDASIVVIPQTTGPVVPVAALITDAGGRHLVRLASGEDVEVTVVQSSQGVAVVDGISPGDVVVLPFASDGG